MAINTGLVGFLRQFMHFLSRFFLLAQYHGIKAVTAFTSGGIIGFHIFPNILRHCQTVFFKGFLIRQFIGNQGVPYVFNCHYFRFQIMEGVILRNMAIGTFCADTFTVRKMNTAFPFFFRICHRVAADTKFRRTGFFHNILRTQYGNRTDRHQAQYGK